MLSPDQERAVTLLAVGNKPSAVAATLGVDDRTIRRWRALPEFQAELQEAQSAIREAGKVRLLGLFDDALDTVQEVMRDVGAPPAARLRAAEVVISRVGLEELAAKHSTEPHDVERVLAFMRWEQEQSNKQGGSPRSEQNGSDPTGAGD